MTITIVHNLWDKTKSLVGDQNGDFLIYIYTYIYIYILSDIRDERSIHSLHDDYGVVIDYQIPIPSMYGIFTYIWLIFIVNVGTYTIHG